MGTCSCTGSSGSRSSWPGDRAGGILILWRPFSSPQLSWSPCSTCWRTQSLCHTLSGIILSIVINIENLWCCEIPGFGQTSPSTRSQTSARPYKPTIQTSITENEVYTATTNLLTFGRCPIADQMVEAQRKSLNERNIFFLNVFPGNLVLQYSNSKVIDVVVPSISTGNHEVISLLAQGGGESGGQGGGQVDHDGCRDALEASTYRESSTCSPVLKAGTSLQWQIKMKFVLA